MVGVMGVSVPATMAAVDTTDRNSLFGSLYNIAESAYNKAKEKIEGFEGQLKEEYEGKWEEGKGNVVESHTQVIDTYREGKNWVKGASDEVQKYAEEVNYYSFTFGNVVKQALAHIPTIITDSTMELINPEIINETNLLSVGKMIMTANSSKLTDFVSGVKTALDSHKEKMGNISYEDAQGIIKIFKNINYDQKSISDFLEKVQKNSSKLESNYQCTTKLLIDLLIGKEQISQIKTYAQSLKEIEDMIGDLKNSDALKDLDFDTFKKQLEQISNMQNIGDPCPSSSGDVKA